MATKFSLKIEWVSLDLKLYSKVHRKVASGFMEAQNPTHTSRPGSLCTECHISRRQNREQQHKDVEKGRQGDAAREL